ncbi:dual OB domain-containing protein [Aeromonas dhakensis]|uniref:dual OB domain-containing protein n=1 Tax=Aeromonas dhakensis TaxID=196024 RepID=UPI003B9DCEA3
MTVSSIVAIVSRTRMSNQYICVGGYDIRNQRYIRLLDDRASRLTNDYPYQVGEFYKLTYAAKYIVDEPHTEDVAVYEYSQYDEQDIDFSEIIDEIAEDNESLSDLFEQELKWENNHGFIDRDSDLNYSVTISTLDNNLVKTGIGQIYYKERDTDFEVKYVGQTPHYQMPNVITAGTPIRFSLARWWDKDGDENHRCYLQLSGIY